jgi:G3E family GTPase
MSEEDKDRIEDEDQEEIPESEKSAVTIVTGFLGSGKTTLVNYILKEQTDWKICVIENEFGEVSIDNELVEENMASREDIITMDNGCVCCSIRGDLVRTFATLVTRRKEFDAIIIETTGLADPSPIVFTFNSNALMQDNYRIDSVVCLVDAKHVNIHLDEVKPDGNINEAEHQIAFSDRIILNKLDLVTKEELEDIEERIKSMNSFAKIIKSERSRVPLDQVLGLNSFSLDSLLTVDPTMMEEEEEEAKAEQDHNHMGHVHDEHCGHLDHAHGHAHDSAHVHDEHCSHDHGHGHEHVFEKADSGHDHGHAHGHAAEAEAEAPLPKKKKKTHNLSLVSSVGYSITGDLDVPLFNTFMSNLLAEKSADLYRTKGILSFSDQGNTKFVFQGVHEQINFGPSEKSWAEGEERISKMVFIGKNLDVDHFKESLLSCATDPSTAKIIMHKR